MIGAGDRIARRRDDGQVGISAGIGRRHEPHGLIMGGQQASILLLSARRERGAFGQAGARDGEAGSVAGDRQVRGNAERDGWVFYASDDPNRMRRGEHDRDVQGRHVDGGRFDHHDRQGCRHTGIAAGDRVTRRRGDGLVEIGTGIGCRCERESNKLIASEQPASVWLLSAG